MPLQLTGPAATLPVATTERVALAGDVMRAPWTMQVASDVIRDGLGLELLDASLDVVAEVFRSDRDHTVTVRVFDSAIPEDVVAELVQHARTALGDFEDGTPLPDTFTVESAV
jgi:hypothetical protein